MTDNDSKVIKKVNYIIVFAVIHNKCRFEDYFLLLTQVLTMILTQYSDGTYQSDNH